jgi:hypothetical protein
MRTVTKTYHVFNFSELEPKVQERVIRRYREHDSWCWDSVDSDNLTEHLRDKAITGGFDSDVKVLWSLSNCQGDGVAFEGEYKITDNFVTRHGDSFNYNETRRLFWLIKNDLRVKVRNGGRYSHYNSMTYEVYCDYDEQGYYIRDEKLVLDLLDKVYPLIKQDIQELSRECESDGYNEIEYHSSDEYIKNEIDGRELEFLVDGEEFDE